MIDWLRKEQQDPAIDVGDRTVPIAIRRHARARRLTMRVAADGSEIRITLPTWGRTTDALAFAQARAEWIARQLDKVPEKLTLADGRKLPFRGGQLVVHWHQKGPRKPRREGDGLMVGGPIEGLEGRVKRWLEQQALELCRTDLDFYCERAGLAVPDLRLSRAQRRWGSCSGDRKTGRCIRINWRLVMAPDHVRRSVVAHEVAHLVHFDHSSNFHRLLGELFEGDIADADGWLKREGRTLYAAFA